MSEIKPIETQYKGYRFRSRLEARWAVFFDALGIKWEYEKEGYQLKSGWYLPDFFLPDYDCWIEIKGPKPTLLEQKLAEELHHATGSLVFLFDGLPEVEKPGIGMAHDSGESSAGFSQWDDVKWSICDTCDRPQLTIGYDSPERSIMTSDWEGWKGDCGHGKFFLHHRALCKAFDAAKQARFEHGEKGISN